MENEVLEIISKLKNSAPGWDGFDANTIKEIKDLLLVPLTHVCNVSLSTGIFPNELKIANVVPIYKADDDAIFTNFRPVSVLSVFFKNT